MMYHKNLSNLSYVLVSLTILLLSLTIQKVSSLLCYSCVSTQPGCTLTQVNWLIYSAISCPEPDDKCLKIIERHGSEVRVTRDCLSNIIPVRDDIPADHFEGCRPGDPNPKRAVFVDNVITELDLKKSAATHFSNVTYCFCEFDHWCNGATTTFTIGTTALIAFATIIGFFSPLTLTS